MLYQWILLPLLPVLVGATCSHDEDQKLILSDANVPKCDCTGVAGGDGDKYLCNNKLLGPKKLPRDFPSYSIVSDYNRLGGLKPKDFLEKWYNASSELGWKYPEERGYYLDKCKNPIKFSMTLPVGTKLDRFGEEKGTFSTHHHVLKPNH